MATTVDASIPLGVQSPTTQTAMSNMSSLLGIQQQQQSLAQSKVKTAQDQATLEEQNALAKINPRDYIDPSTGIIDADRYMKDAMAATPRTGLGVQRATAVYGAQQAQTAVNQAGQDLNRSIRGDVAGRFSAISTDPNATYNDYVRTGEAIKKDNPQAGKLVDSYLQQLPADMDINTLHARASTLNRAVLPVGENQPKPTTVDTGPDIQPGTASPTTGAFTAAGPAIKKGLAPTDQPAYRATVASATTRAAATGNADIDTSNQVVASQRDAKANIDLPNRIDQLAEVVNPGTIPGKVSSALGALGLQDVNQARTELDKDLARLKGNLASRAQSDTRAGPILDSLPDSTKPTDTIHQAMDVTRGLAKQDLALGRLRDKSAQATGGQMTGFQGDYAHAVSAASPLMHEYMSLSPSQQVEFFKRNFATKEQARAFRDQAQSVKRLSPDVIGQ